MTKLSDLGKPIHGELLMPANDDHFYTCEHCGQVVDRRDVHQLIWHEMPGHEPLETDE